MQHALEDEKYIQDLVQKPVGKNTSGVARKMYLWMQSVRPR
jgi:hypothetical protein